MHSTVTTVNNTLLYNIWNLLGENLLELKCSHHQKKKRKRKGKKLVTSWGINVSESRHTSVRVTCQELWMIITTTRTIIIITALFYKHRTQF